MDGSKAFHLKTSKKKLLWPQILSAGAMSFLLAVLLSFLEEALVHNFGDLFHFNSLLWELYIGKISPADYFAILGVQASFTFLFLLLFMNRSLLLRWPVAIIFFMFWYYFDSHMAYHKTKGFAGITLPAIRRRAETS